MSDTDGLDRPESLDSLFGPWRGAARIVVAVSGGPDSMALLHLMSRWRGAGNGPEILAATVDHGLRPEAAQEAALVGELARRLGVDHAVLTWRRDRDPDMSLDGPEGMPARTQEPRTRLQERARAARYALLGAHARALGADVVMTAHHGDDQAETILFRLIRGSSITGLAGMAADSARDGLRLARPLLGLRKEELVRLCRTRQIPFSDDPSNRDPRYARSRMRDILPLLEREGLGPAQWSRLAGRLRRAAAALQEQERAARRDIVCMLPDGSLGADARVFADLPEEIALRVLKACITELSGRAPRLDRCERMLERLLPAATSAGSFRATLGGACVSVTGAGRLTIAPAPGRRAAPPRDGAQRAKKAEPPENCFD